MKRELPDILFAAGTPAGANKLAAHLAAGRIRPLMPLVYTSDINGKDEDIIGRNLWRLLSYKFPKAVLSHRSALEYMLTKSGTVYLTGRETRAVKWPGVTIRIQLGPGPLPSDTRLFADGLNVASEERAMLENLGTYRMVKGESRTVDREFIEKRLLNILNARGEEGLNALRDKARAIAEELGMSDAFARLNALVASLLATGGVDVLRSTAARAHVQGEPYDTNRLSIFNALIAALKATVFAERKERVKDDKEFANIAFFESYFSNYIEGTEFEVEQAREIVYTGRDIPNRSGDSHDIRGVYAVCADRSSLRARPANAEEFIERMRQRHAVLLAGRPDKDPGFFKQRPNRAGSTHFVAPGMVVGTLKQGWDLMGLLTDPLARALYIMFVVSETHPFNDGNGRIARVMMNAELVAQGCTKLIIPNVYREDYLLALRRLSRGKDAGPYIRMMDRAHAWSHWLDPATLDGLEQQIERSNALKEPDEAGLDWPV
ncbi:MAG: Fic family protein [Flavobacteriales bacterium]|nr:Fic family protein [Flavobacteriales bacterium]